MRRTLQLIVLLAIAPVAALGDAPLPPPSSQETESENKEITVVSSPSDGTHILESSSRRELWSMPGWFRWLFVSDDGACVATGYGGLNLIPQDYSEDLVLVTFWQRGDRVGEVHVRDVYSDGAEPIRTVSHYHWGTIKGFSDDGTLVVQRADGKVLEFPACRSKQ